MFQFLSFIKSFSVQLYDDTIINIPIVVLHDCSWNLFISIFIRKKFKNIKIFFSPFIFYRHLIMRRYCIILVDSSHVKTVKWSCSVCRKRINILVWAGKNQIWRSGIGECFDISLGNGSKELLENNPFSPFFFSI